MYAIGFDWARAYAQGMELLEGEVVMAEVPSEVEARITAKLVRARRHSALRESDWTQMPDAPLTAMEMASYQTYRQALRDLPSLPGFPDVPWPTLPTIKEGTAGTGEGSVYP